MYRMKRRVRRLRIHMGVDDKVRLATALLSELGACASIYFLDMIILLVPQLLVGKLLILFLTIRRC